VKKGLIVLILLLCSCSPGLPKPTVTPPPTIEPEEYAVYAALIRQNPIGYDLGSYFLVREQAVSGGDMAERALKEAKSVPSGLADSYRSRNAASYTLSPDLDVEQDYSLMPQEEFEKLFLQPKSQWTDFETEYPGASGFVAFSRVGFNASEDKALAEMGYRCGDLCGAGGLYVLAKEDGNWKVEEELQVWQS